MKNIFNVYVVMESQEQCDRMKQVCIDNGLPIWDDEIAFLFDVDNINYFSFSLDMNFAVWLTSFKIIDTTTLIQATEKEFLQLLKEYKDGK